MLRRALALGGGLVLLILLVLGVKGCLDARANRELSDYARDVTQIVEETQQISKSFFDRLEDPGNLSVTEFIDQVDADRSAMDGYAERIDELGAPGDMAQAQDSLELAYALRVGAMGEIAEKMNTALGEVGAEKAMSGVARQMQKLLAADVIYETVVRPEVDGVLAEEGISGNDLPQASFLPDEKWLEASTVEDALGAISGGIDSNVSGVHGTEITGVTVNATELVEGAPTTVAGEEGVEVEISVRNPLESTENGIDVAVTYEGNTVTGEIDELPAGETVSTVIPLIPAPSGEVTLEIEVESVPGEQLTENNEASYTVLIE